VASASRREGLPRVILKAMAASRPVVATDIRGHRDLVVPGQTGYLVPAGDPAAMAGVLVTLLRDPSVAGALGARARERAEEFAVERAVAAMEPIYACWLGGSAGEA